MTDQIKQRIVGICVLVFLALIILPWLFGGNPSVVFEDKNKQQKEKWTAADLPEVVKQPPEVAKPIPDDLVAKVTTTATAETTDKNNQRFIKKDIQLNSVKEKRVTEVNATTLNHIENAIVHNQPEAKVEPPQKNADLPAIELKKPSFSIIKSPMKLSVSKKGVDKQGDKNLTIQLGTFTNKKNAQKLVYDLKAKAYPAYSKSGKNSHGDEIIRVYIGPISEKHSAEEMIKKIEKSFKLHGVIAKSTL